MNIKKIVAGVLIGSIAVALFIYKQEEKIVHNAVASENNVIDATESAPAEPDPALSHDENVNYQSTYTNSGYSSGSGHDAGYDWAEENNIDDSSDCDGNSNSFNEGCEEYVSENSVINETLDE